MNGVIKNYLLKWFLCFLLAVITLAVFAPISDNNFISLDDMNYVVNNHHIQQGLTWSAVKWAFSTFHSSNWHPLTWLSHIMDCRLYGLDPAGPHVTNLVFHIANTLLLFLLLQNLTAKLWPSAFVSLLFAIHPMHVESVAWVSERKDVLSAFFFLLTLLAYARYAELVKEQKRARWLVYGLALLLFALGLMAKPMLVTLPCVLCLLDFWPLARFQLPLKNQKRLALWHLAMEKVPFILLAAISCWVTFIAQNATGAVKPDADFPLATRLEHIPVAYAWYVLKFVWPSNLSIFYLLQLDQSTDAVAGAVTLLAVITAVAFMLARQQPWLLAGWLWFAGMLVPVLGLVQVGNQAYADRYSYLPYIGLSICFAWGIAALLAKWPRCKPVVLAGAVLASAAFCKLSVDQVHVWKNSQTLYGRALELDPKNEEAWALAGLDFMYQGDTDKAIDCMRRATAINDKFNWAWHDLGEFLVYKNDYAGAEHAFQMALSSTWFDGDKKNIYVELGNLLVTTGRYPEAIADFQNALALAPDQPDIQTELGQCFIRNQQPDQASIAFQNAIRSQPNNAEARLGLAMILESNRNNTGAIAQYRKVVELQTNSIIALNNLAWLLATATDARLRNGKEAVPLAEHACQLTQNQQAFLIGTLAAAYAEAGRFDDATAAAQKAHDVALASGQKEIADRNEQLMEIYKSGRAFHMDSQTATQKSNP